MHRNWRSWLALPLVYLRFPPQGRGGTLAPGVRSGALGSSGALRGRQGEGGGLEGCSGAPPIGQKQGSERGLLHLPALPVERGLASILASSSFLSRRAATPGFRLHNLPSCRSPVSEISTRQTTGGSWSCAWGLRSQAQLLPHRRQRFCAFLAEAHPLPDRHGLLPKSRSPPTAFAVRRGPLSRCRGGLLCDGAGGLHG